jgi:hypothetical protein
MYWIRNAMADPALSAQTATYLPKRDLATFRTSRLALWHTLAAIILGSPTGPIEENFECQSSL